MQRYKLVLEYDGSYFHGWQRQEATPTVQGLIEDSLHMMTQEKVLVEGAGRTDQGVHALAQVAHVDLNRPYTPGRLMDGLNFFLRNHGACVRSVTPVAPTFHARFSAVARSYQYLILNRRAPSILQARRVWHIIRPLNISLMQEGAKMLMGDHDFSSFRNTNCQASSPLRTLDHFQIENTGELVTVHLKARSFLHNQVRIMIGSLALVGQGVWSLNRLAEALAAKNRTSAGPTAPAYGLYLAAIDYPLPTV